MAQQGAAGPKSSTVISTEQLSVQVGDKPLLQEIDFRFSNGELIALLGPNGAGKTTLLRTLLGLQKASAGRALLNNRPVQTYAGDVRARQVAYLPQDRPMAWPNRVVDVVALGRFAHGVVLGKMSATDSAAVQQALHACDLQEFATRKTDTLSGGEMARVHCARVYAADAPLLIADEPTAGLDPLHQHTVLSLLRNYVDAGHGVLVVLHDVNLALRYADRLVWMKHSRIVAEDRPMQVTRERLRQIYDVPAWMHDVEQDVGQGLAQIPQQNSTPLRQVMFAPPHDLAPKSGETEA